MPNYNKVMLVGHLVRDNELKYTPKGTAICNNAVAVSRKWRSESGEPKEEVAFVDFTIFGKSAETFTQYTKKGYPILIDGRIKQETWDDKSTGKKRSKLIVAVESFQFLKGKDDAASDTPSSPPSDRPASDAPPSTGTAEDDVPF